jgi:hypothetical protein
VALEEKGEKKREFELPHNKVFWRELHIFVHFSCSLLCVKIRGPFQRKILFVLCESKIWVY